MDEQTRLTDKQSSLSKMKGNSMEDRKIYKKKFMRNRMIKARKALELNQENFGEKLGLGRRQITNLETGTVRLSKLHLIAFEHVYGIRQGWMKTGRGNIFEKKD
jgi:DNA-binding XRE family transcriptional regulator